MTDVESAAKVALCFYDDIHRLHLFVCIKLMYLQE